MDMLDEIEKKQERKKVFRERLLNKIISRKVLVWSVSSVAMFTGHIDVNTWMMISMTFIGSEAVTNTTLAWKGGKTK